MLNAFVSAVPGAQGQGPATHRRRRGLTLLRLIAATYFMVSGGPYGLEELLAQVGFPLSLALLALIPIIWSFPTVLLVGELSSALPKDGGYYVWVRRALGPFWGVQEAWLSLAASIFDMAIYPTLFISYLARLWPAAGIGQMPWLLGTAMIVACALWNVLGARAVGGAAVGMTLALLVPFAVLTVLALCGPHAAATSMAPSVASASTTSTVYGGIFIAMWNYMGWDSASTIAGEVERPQRNYPLAMLCVVGFVALTYLIPLAAIARTGLNPHGWTNGAWVDVAAGLGGPLLARGVMAGGMICGAGMFNALVLSYSRLPVALAEDKVLPAALARRHPRTGAPWVAILVCATAWAACLGLGFQRLVEIDVLLYGLSLVLEFVALVVLRVREPGLPRPFRVPGGTLGAVAIGIGPVTLLAMALLHHHGESAGALSSLELGALLTIGGPILYGLGRRRQPATGGALAAGD